VITGAHALIYSTKAEEVRAFFRDKLDLPYVDSGDGWLIFGLPPAEVGVHPITEGGRHELYLMCDNIETTVAELTAKGVEFDGPVIDAGFGLLTSIALPGGTTLGLYEPRHPTVADADQPQIAAT